MDAFAQFFRCASICAVLAFAQPHVAHAANLSQWRTDIRAIVAAIEETHPGPFLRTGRQTFFREKDRLLRDMPRLSEPQRTVRAMALVALLGDGHTQLNPIGDDYRWWFPLRFYEFSDGYFISAVRNEHSELAGARVLEIGGIPAAEAARRARALFGADNEFGARENLHALSSAPLMEGLGLAANRTLTLRLQRRGANAPETVTLAAMQGDPSDPDTAGFEWRFRNEVFGPFVGEPSDWVSAYNATPSLAYRTVDETRPPHLRYRRHYYAGPVNADTYLIQVNFIGDHPDEPFVTFFRRALADVDRRRPHQLIVDFRYNSGGDGSLVRPMIHEFIKREDAPPWRNLYVLSGRKTFSAAIMALRAFADHTDATFVGEPAGAAYNHFGDAAAILLPSGQLRLSVSTLHHQLSDSNDTRHTIQIDVPALFSSADYFAGHDPAIDAIARGDEMRALPIIVRTDGPAAARATYISRRAQYQDLSWWQPTDERALNGAAYVLLRGGRAADAIEAFQLNADIFPGSWNVWDSLGEAQRAAGDNAGARISYRRSLQLNPGNSNAQRALRELGEAPTP